MIRKLLQRPVHRHEPSGPFMLTRDWCLLCQSYQLGPCRTPDDAAQCPMQKPGPDDDD
jgi:hypothetical protein